MPDERADVVVTCTRHADSPQFFPQVIGYYLAKHLRRAGVRASFRHLPLPGLECEVLICCEYQAPMEWFDRHLAEPLAEIEAAKMFCVIEYSLGVTEHWASDYCKWFAPRGGVLCLLDQNELAPYEHWIGVGVDPDVVGFARGSRRDVIFDFPHGAERAAAGEFETEQLVEIRRRLPDLRLVGTGPPDTEQQGAFEEWFPIGRPHDEYVGLVFQDALAFVPGQQESLGLSLAEAQVAGACIVHGPWQAKPGVLCPEADVAYTPDGPGALADAVAEARLRDGSVIREQALERFDYSRVAERTRAAIGL